CATHYSINWNVGLDSW
nr:immunoglobulin heavy chain junction region [Macaca mulatta]MOV51213.1 immunoglobulin heavy chain junction region [Macaca mulatta]MOV52380.1 immunoglobulin heavy chain junction region [Macaca mulatta]